jgi:hypothetical protein
MKKLTNARKFVKRLKIVVICAPNMKDLSLNKFYNLGE